MQKSYRLYLFITILFSFIFSANCTLASSLQYIEGKTNNKVTNSTVDGVNAEMETPDFWIKKLSLPNEIIMSENDIIKTNNEIRKKMTNNVDLLEKPLVIEGNIIKSWIEKNIEKAKEYQKEGVESQALFVQQEDNCNFKEIKDEVVPQLGFTLKQTDMRALPTKEAFFTDSAKVFDYYQETRLDPGEPLIILHTSTDKKWYFVQSSNYRAWVFADNIALSKDSVSWVKKINAKDFLVVTSSSLIIEKKDGKEKEQLVYEMGAKIPLLKNNKKEYIAEVPFRDKKGYLAWKTVKIPKNAPVNVGFLPFTRANIINLAFEFHKQKYGWGGMFDSVDCSSLAMNIYRTMGLMLPRNADEQALAVESVKWEFAGDEKARLLGLSKILPGDQLFTPEHTMIYLGENEGKYYIIHAINALYEGSASGVLVTPLDLSLQGGKNYINKLTSVNSYGFK